MLKKILAALLIAILLAAGGFAFWHRAYLQRLTSFPRDAPMTSVKWYSPKELVMGQGGTPFPRATLTEIPQKVLDKLGTYAYVNNSSALLIAHHGKLIYERYWFGHTAISTSNSGSMAKTVLALLVGLAISDGKIHALDDPLSRYITEWARDPRGKITLRQLLHHTSGLKNDTRERDPRSARLRMHMGPDANRVALSCPAATVPGKAFEHNDFNTQILGIVLARATGKRLSEYLSERLWQPLGASTGALWLDRKDGNPKVYCCLFATAIDWLRVGQLILDKGQFEGKPLVAGKWIEQMTSPSPKNPAYGLHIWRAHNGPQRKDMRREPFVDDQMIYLAGRFKQRVYILPRHELVIVRVGENADRWDDAMLPNTLVRALAKVTKENPPASRPSTLPARTVTTPLQKSPADTKLN